MTRATTLLLVIGMAWLAPRPLAAHEDARHHHRLPHHRPRRPDPKTLKIEAIVPSQARPGDRVTIVGHGLGALSVNVAIDDTNAAVVAANGHAITFIVPETDPGLTTVVATNRSRTAAIDLLILEGMLLPGTPTAPAASTLTELPPTPADLEDIDHGVILTRLGARLKSDATVGQVNQALTRIGGGIVTMSHDTPSITVAVPLQNTLADVQALSRVLRTQPGILAAWPAIELQPKYLAGFGVADLPRERFLLPSRFPAAWNAANLMIRDNGDGTVSCRRPRLPVLIADFFGDEPSDFTQRVGSVHPPGPGPLGLAGIEAQHGYLVTMTALGRDGANPFAECLDIHLVQSAGFHPDQDTRAIKANMPPPGEKFIVNYSMGFADSCGGSAAGLPCQPTSDRMPSASDRAYNTMTWKELTRTRWPDFLMVVSAGNEKNDESAAIYPGMSDATVGSAMAIAAKQDALMSFVGDDGRWAPTALGLGFLSLAEDPAGVADIAAEITRRHLDSPDDVATNVLLVGSTINMTAGGVLTNRVAPELLGDSAFSDRFADVLAVGEEIFDNSELQGTSFSAPIVTGLASYMWLLSPELRSLPPSDTAFIIRNTTRPGGSIDAYGAVLALDEVGFDFSIRRAILDVNNDTVFDELDLNEYLENLFSIDQDGTISHRPPNQTTADYSRYDLNGDGFTTSGSRRERFDLDRFGYSADVTQDIEGQTVHFNEFELTDIEILCYYAYSPLYQGTSPALRRSLLEGRCGTAIQPATASLASGQRQQFTAQMPGNPPQVWSTTAPNGGVDQNGLFTAGATAGTYKVRVTNANDQNQFAEATVTISASTGNFRADQQLDARVAARDPFTDFELFPEIEARADNESSTTPPLPLTVEKLGTYHNANLDYDVPFTLKAHANYPTSTQPFFIPASGEQTSDVFCTSTGPKLGPRTGSSSFGTLNIPAVGPDGRTPADITVTLGGALSRGPGSGDLNGNTAFNGAVHVEWISGGVRQTAFTINAADYSAGGGGQVDTAINQTLHVTAPGFVEIRWNLAAGCQARGAIHDDINEVETAGGSVRLTYSLSR